LLQILYIADIRADWDNFRGCVVLTATSKTIVTFNPSSPDAKLLLTFAADADLSSDGKLDELIKTVDYKTIQVLWHFFPSLLPISIVSVLTPNLY
jgi:hypothetical protein